MTNIKLKTDIWMAWYPSDYLKDTLELSLEEDAIYRRALDYLWQNPAGLPRVSSRLCRCLRITESELERCVWVLDKYLETKGEVYRSNRIDSEYSKTLKRKEIAQKNGRSGGRPKNPDGNPEHNPDDNQNSNQKYNPEKSSSSSPSPIIPSPSEKGQQADIKPKVFIQKCKEKQKRSTHGRLQIFLDEFESKFNRPYVVGDYAAEGGAAARTLAKIPDDTLYHQAVRAYLANEEKRYVEAGYSFRWFIADLQRWLSTAMPLETAKKGLTNGKYVAHYEQ